MAMLVRWCLRGGIAILITTIMLVVWLLSTRSGLEFALARIPDLTVSKIEGRALGLIKLKDIAYKSTGVIINISQLEFDWEPSKLWSNQLRINRFILNKLTVERRDSLSTETATTDGTVFDLTALPDIQLKALSVDGFVFRQDGREYALNSVDATEVNLRQAWLELGRVQVSKDHEFVGVRGALNLSFLPAGEVDLTITHRLESMLGLSAVQHGQHNLSGNWGALQLDLELRGWLNADGRLSAHNLLEDNVTWQTNLDLQWPLTLNDTQQGPQFSIKLTANGDHQNAILDVSAIEKTGLGEVTVSGQVSDITNEPYVDVLINAEQVDVIAHALGVNLPPSNLKLNLAGQADDYALTLQAASSANNTGPEVHDPSQLGRFTLNLSAQGDASRLQAKEFKIEGDKISLTSDLLLTFSEQQQTLLINRAEGRWFDQNIAAAANIVKRGRLAQIHKLDVNVGDSFINAQGQIGDQLDLKWGAQISDLSHYTAKFAGQFTAAGEASGSLTAPVVDATVKAQDVSFDAVSLASIDGQVNFNQHVLNSKLNLSDVRYQQEAWLPEFDVTIEGTLQKHLMVMALPSGEGGFNAQRIELNGQFVDQIWSFGVTADPLPMSLSKVLTAKQDFDLLGVLELGAQGRHHTEQGWLDLNAKLESKEIILDARSNELEDLEFKDPELSLTADTEQTLVTIKSLIDEQGEFELQTQVASALTSDAFKNAPFELKGSLNYADLSSLAVALPDGVELSGKLSSDITAFGSLNEPKLSLDAELSGGGLQLKEHGVSLDDIGFSLAPTQNNKVKITAQAKAGDGRLTVDGVLAMSNELDAEITLKADNARLLETPEILAEIDSDLVVRLRDTQTSVIGEINVRQADITVGVSPSVIRESPDVVVIGQTESVETTALDLDVLLDFGNQAGISASGLTGRLAGKPRIKTNQNGLLTSVGEISIVDGQFSLLGEALTVRKGVASYTGGDISRPQLNIEAVKEVGATTVGVNVTGRADSPSITFISQPSQSDQDILSLIFFDKTVSTLGASDALRLIRIANALRNGNVDGGSRFNDIQKSVARAVGIDQLDVDINAGSGEVSVSSKINSRIDIGYAYNLVSALQSLLVRYRINKNWSIQSAVDSGAGADLIYRNEK